MPFSELNKYSNLLVRVIIFQFDWFEWIGPGPYIRARQVIEIDNRDTGLFRIYSRRLDACACRVKGIGND